MKPLDKPQTFYGSEFTLLYQRMLAYCLSEGATYKSPRGMPVSQGPAPVLMVLNNNSRRWALIPRRGLNPGAFVAEVFWILAGRGDFQFMKFWCESLGKYLDPGKEEFHGAYGTRLRRFPGFSEEGKKIEVDQLVNVVDILMSDPDSRQAVVSLWCPGMDGPSVKTLDRPCNNMLLFDLVDNRHGKHLNLTVVRRSNDVILGSPLNVIQWTHVQDVVAATLGVWPGQYREYIHNLHLYQDLYPRLKAWAEWVVSQDLGGCSTRINALARPTTPSPTIQRFDEALPEFLEFKELLESGTIPQVSAASIHQRFRELYRSAYWADLVMVMTWYALFKHSRWQRHAGIDAWLAQITHPALRWFCDEWATYKEETREASSV